MNQIFKLKCKKISVAKLLAFFVGMLFFLDAVPSLPAAIMSTGSVTPLPWDNMTYGQVGIFSDGTLTIDATSLLESYSCDIAASSGVTGTVTVTGNGSIWNSSGNITVGASGNGILNIEAGGQLNNINGILGGRSFWTDFGTGTVAVTGSESQWNNSGNLDIGSNGSGALTIQAGGWVRSTTSNIGNAGSVSVGASTVTVTGIGSTWINSGTLDIRTNSSNSLTVSEGGEIITGTLYASLSNLHGNGTIIATQGAIVDADLHFDAAHGTQASVPFGTGGILQVNAAGGDLGLGYRENVSLTVSDGVTITSNYGYLGYTTGSMGTATITGTGSKWLANNALFVGYAGDGALRIEAGGQVSITDGYLGESWNRVSGTVNTTGAATVTGNGSKWTNSGNLHIGSTGIGILRVEAGGQVFSHNGYIADAGNASSLILMGTTFSGAATVTGKGSKWINIENLHIGGNGSGTLTVSEEAEVTTQTIFTSLNKLLGNGSVIATSGAVLDANLRFDASQGTQQILAFGSGGKLSINFDASGILGVGYSAGGNLTIDDGITVSSSTGYLGYKTNATGTATVSGIGSQWTIGSSLYVGNSGNGAITIKSGGVVTNSDAYIGNASTSTGLVTVTGVGSKWISSRNLIIGNMGGRGTLFIEAGGQVFNNNGYINSSSSTYGSSTALIIGSGSKWINYGDLYVNGTLNIRNGGSVLANRVNVSGGLFQAKGLLTIDAGNSSTVNVGAISNDGLVRILAGPRPAAGSQVSPIAASTWSGTGSYQALGGMWNAASRVFSVSQTLNGTSGTMVAIDAGWPWAVTHPGLPQIRTCTH